MTRIHWEEACLDIQYVRGEFTSQTHLGKHILQEAFWLGSDLEPGRPEPRVPPSIGSISCRRDLTVRSLRPCSVIGDPSFPKLYILNGFQWVKWASQGRVLGDLREAPWLLLEREKVHNHENPPRLLGGVPCAGYVRSS